MKNSFINNTTVFNKVLGEGNHGVIYRLSSSRIIKVFKDEKSLLDESKILKKVSNSRFFPKVYDIGDDYIIRESVEGTELRKILKKGGGSEILYNNLLELLSEFYKLGFKKIDVRLRDIIVQDDLSFILIDPKGFYSRKKPFPSHLLKGLKALNLNDEFLDFTKKNNKNLYYTWIPYIETEKILQKV